VKIMNMLKAIKQNSIEFIFAVVNFLQHDIFDVVLYLFAGVWGTWFDYDKGKDKNADIRIEIERNIVPNAKTKEEFRTYITEVLGMVRVPMTEMDLIDQNAQFILKLCPELLTTPLVEYPTGCTPTMEEQSAVMDNHTKRFMEARKIPLERTGFVFTKYMLEWYVDTYKLADIEVFLEENTYTYTASGRTYSRTDEEERVVRHFIDTINIFRGVTEEDIRTKSEWYNTYVTYLTGHALEEQQKQ